MNNLTLAAIERNKKWMASLPENPPEVEYSKKHIKEMNKILDKMRGDRYHRLTRKTTRVLIAAAVIIALMTVTVFATDLGAYILDELSDHAIFQSLLEPEEAVDGKIECGYIPDGFEVAKENYDENHCFVVYENNNGDHISIFKRRNGDEMGMDNEYAQKSVVYISNAEVIVYEKDNGDIRVVWCDDNYTYRIGGDISQEEAIKIAENLK